MACLNGLEAAKLIRQRSPSTGIVFLSANLDANIQQAALNIGHAFVLKSRATDDLLPAVEKVHAAAASEREDSGSLSART
jgi:DNA-binding NarL/FixJ family response regulator